MWNQCCSEAEKRCRFSIGEFRFKNLMTFAVVFEKTDTGYSAHVPDLPGCIAAGADIEETLQLIREAVEMHLEGIREDGDPIPQPTTITDYVTVPQDMAG